MNRILLMVLRNITRVPGAWIKLCRYARDPEKYTDKEMYDHVRYILGMAVTSGNIDLKVYGKENIPKENGYMVYSNHQGMFDTLAMVHVMEEPMAVVFKKEIKNIPFLKQVTTCTNSFAMDRSDVRQSMTVIQAVTKEVKKGKNYIIFPEGTRSKKGNEMLEFHAGSFRPAVKAKCPILPVALIDFYKVLDQKGCDPVTVQLHYLEPIQYEEFKDMNTNELALMVHDRIEAVVKANS